MASVGNATHSAFRTRFDFRNKTFQNWFPGHMVTGLKKLQAALWNCDAVVEVHDARIPLTGRTELFKDWFTRARPHILLLNKADLTDMSYADEVVHRIKHADPRSGRYASHVMYTDFKNNTIKTKIIVPAIVDIITQNPRHNRSENIDYKVMIIGAPNVGKSTLINLLRAYHMGNKATIKVGSRPGVTRSVSNRIRIHEQPTIYVLDSPGVLPPTVKNIEIGMKLAACLVTPDDLVGEVNVVDYLLYWWNKQRDFRYVELYKLNGPVDNVYELLVHVALTQNIYLSGSTLVFGSQKRSPDVLNAAKRVLRKFHEGASGKIMLDADILYNSQTDFDTGDPDDNQPRYVAEMHSDRE